MNEVSTGIKFDTIVDKEEYDKFLAKVTKGEVVSKGELKQFGSLMQNEFAIDRLESKQLKAMCKFFGLPAIGTNFLIREGLAMKVKKIYADDEALLKEGIDMLTFEELEDAVVARGIKIDQKDCTREQLIQKLKDWVELTRVPVPIYLHLLVLAHTDVAHAKPAVQEMPAPSKAELSWTDIKRRLLPELIEIKNFKHEDLVSDKVVDRLQSKVHSMVQGLEHQLESQASQTPTVSSKVAEKADNHNLSPQALSFVIAVFNIFDRDDDNKVDFEELKYGMIELGISSTEAELKELFNNSDKDKNGSIDLNEFVNCVITLRDKLQKEQTQ